MDIRLRGEPITVRMRAVCERSPRELAAQAVAILRAADVGAPVVAFVGASIALWIASEVQGAPFFRSSSWIRWDSAFYIQIAASGYHVFPCMGPPYPPHSLCGNAGWFPGYSGVLAPLFDLGLPQGATALIVSWLFALGLLILLWRGFVRGLPGPTKYLALAFAAFGPGGVYTRAVFPMSMTAFFMLLCVWYLLRGRPAAAGVAGGVAAACYPTTVLLAPICVVWTMFADRERRFGPRLGRAALSGALVLAGAALALAVMRIQTGSWTAYFKTQAKYDHGLHEPFAELWPSIHAVLKGVRGIAALPQIEATVVAVISLVLLAGYAVRLVQRRAERLETLTAVLVAVFWLAPLTQANVSYYRSDALLIPAALLVPKLPAAVGVLVLAALIPLFSFMAFGFFQAILV